MVRWRCRNTTATPPTAVAADAPLPGTCCWSATTVVGLDYAPFTFYFVLPRDGPSYPVLPICTGVYCGSDMLFTRRLHPTPRYLHVPYPPHTHRLFPRHISVGYTYLTHRCTVPFIPTLLRHYALHHTRITRLPARLTAYTHVLPPTRLPIYPHFFCYPLLPRARATAALPRGLTLHTRTCRSTRGLGS